jgi:hypothetical protein
MSNPRSVPLQLQPIASNYGVPIFPIIRRGSKEFGMFSGLRQFPWAYAPLRYKTTPHLTAQLGTAVIKPARREALRLTKRKRLVEE